MIEPFHKAPKTGEHILAFRGNGWSWDFPVVIAWCGADPQYPWIAEHSAYPEDRFDYYTPIVFPEEVLYEE